MNDLALSRRAVTRALFLLPAAAVPAAAVAAPAFVCSPALQDPAWLALLAAETEASRNFTAVAAEHDEAYDRLSAARNTLMDAWKKERSATNNPGKFIAARPYHESEGDRCAAGIRDYNANNARLAAEKSEIEGRARKMSGFADVDQRYEAASSRHRSTISAVIAYPTRNPDFIADKLRLLIKEFGDETDELSPLLTSIEGVI